MEMPYCQVWAADWAGGGVSDASIISGESFSSVRCSELPSPHISHTRLFPTLWMVACQAPLSMRFPRQECWRGLPFPPPGDLPDSGIEPVCAGSPALQVPSLALSKPSHHKSPHIYSRVGFSLSPLQRPSLFEHEWPQLHKLAQKSLPKCIVLKIIHQQRHRVILECPLRSLLLL